MTEEKIIIELPDKMIVLKSTTYDNEIDVDSALSIDYGNIMGEILTFPVFLNRVGVLLAEAEDSLRQAQFEIGLSEKELKNVILQAKKRAKTSLKQSGTNSPTLEEISIKASEDEIAKKAEADYNDEYLQFLRVNKERDQINTLYWSAKSKDEKLNKISDKIRPEDFQHEILEGHINGIMIKSTEKLLK